MKNKPIKKEGKKEPKYDNQYYFITEDLKVSHCAVWSDTDYDRNRIKKHGWFRTRKQAIKKLSELHKPKRTDKTIEVKVSLCDHNDNLVTDREINVKAQCFYAPSSGHIKLCDPGND